MDRRRFLLTSLAGAVAAPLGADAQQAKAVARVGYLQPGEAPPIYMDVFRDRLRQLGWVEGRNLIIEYRIGPANGDYAPLVAELVNLQVNVIVTWTALVVVAVRRASDTIPIVAVTGDPIATGLVRSLARPGGNVTGIALQSDAVEVKNLQLLKEAVPAASRVAVLTDPTSPLWVTVLKRLYDVGPALGVTIQSLEARGPDDFAHAFATAQKQRADALLVVNDSMFGIHERRLAQLALKYRLPSMFSVVRDRDAGSLVSHSTHVPNLFERLAVYTDKILRGAKPKDLPVEQPTVFLLTINLKTAKALGLTIPPALLARADHVIE